jgi:thiosulfate/3-mercaptopyruvate sulfurtransferase
LTVGLISCQELADLLEEKSQISEQDRPEIRLAICDVRFSLFDHDQGRRDYGEAHIPGAVFVDLHLDLADHEADEGGRHPLPNTARFGAVLDRLGITPDTEVVAYDSAGGAMAARLWWMLRAVGHQRIRVLNGGWPAWISGGFPVSADSAVQHQSGTSYVVPAQWPGVVTATDVERVMAASDPQKRPLLVDARAPERFRGEVEPLDPRAGHIPGAINLFNGLNCDADGLHRPLQELREIYRPLTEAKDVVMYCGSGVAACHNLLILHLMGDDSAQLYAGSWSDWASDPERPGAVGE